MSETLEPNRLSESSQNSFKRKSFEDENNENVSSLNVVESNDSRAVNATKKTRLKEGSEPAAKIDEETSTTKVKSSLPRYQQTLPRAAKKSIVTTPGEKKRITTEQNTTERLPVTTPRKVMATRQTVNTGHVQATVPLFSPALVVDPNSILRRIKKSVSNVASGEGMQSLFDGAFTVSDERVTSIMANLRVKSKWDYKEKSKKQDAVIKDLRDCLSTTFSEAKVLKESCLGNESFVTALLQDSYEELLSNSQSLNALRASEGRSRKDLEQMSEELARTKTAFSSYRSECSPVKNRARESENQLSAVTDKLYREEMKGIQLNAEVIRLQKELSEVKEKGEEAVRSQKDQLEQRLEQSVTSYREEIASLRAELSRRMGDAERFSSERADVDRRRGELSEELIHAQSRLRESETSAKRSEAELQRVCADLAYLKEQLSAKDADLRATISSLNEVQKQSCEDKGSMRSELSALQLRAQVLEDTRVDLTSRLAARIEENSALSRDLTLLRETVSQLENRAAAKELELLAAKENEVSATAAREQQAKAEQREENERRERIACTSQLVAIQSECAEKIREIDAKAAGTVDALRLDLAVAAHQQSEAQQERRRLENELIGKESQIRELNVALENAAGNPAAVLEVSLLKAQLQVLENEVVELRGNLAEAKQTIGDQIKLYEDKLVAGEVQRRKLHNLVQELRGNIRVYARVRPFLPKEQEKKEESCIAVKPDVNSLRILREPKADSDERLEDHSFTFDKVFAQSTSQEAVFAEVSEFVQSALDGYNVCLFSYGQTGSGKTHTMQGAGNGSMRGIIPRAMEQVGVYKSQLEAKGWQYQMQVTFLEIYNETIKDLLRAGSGDSTSSDAKHDIKKDASGNSIVTDVEMVTVDPNDTAQIHALMEQAARFRTTAVTQMNEQSSRSHSVFTLHLKAVNAAQGITLKGTLNLVDLAGSERLERSCATGTQLKEACAINKSLSALTDVFVAIAGKQAHIPFRNSKLTYLLQPALSGDGKTLMMVNLSPTEESFYESLCSLRLAKQVNQCELGKPKRQLRDAKDPPVSSASTSGPSTVSTPSRSAHPLSSSMGNLTSALQSATSAGPQQSALLSSSLGGHRKTPAATAVSSIQGTKRPNLTKR